mmetsp:Transcript_15115/g.32583  ORF Transcript_15115/g.32583 Transcript_15115/m.32583 type:complete len:445 (-) Transcript_15115:315-1649(-)|eukprot:CAMPEP_0206445988 /NCGR_PEP_ID=MMETSP0324_2-20121206/15858_1 /ASSEMBLY_ACC=CAM_ASM_000836 /TAXON_ID=2866 /ORGANISM="Crypthecodinium cohnii, Strain Seligo" /LENGTH=444 /DNA_ID=CAMNT_0053914353 /DNA_START=76 /DNA_END=1410 /DNA_ORIENTATION=+
MVISAAEDVVRVYFRLMSAEIVAERLLHRWWTSSEILGSVLGVLPLTDNRFFLDTEELLVDGRKPFDTLTGPVEVTVLRRHAILDGYRTFIGLIKDSMLHEAQHQLIGSTNRLQLVQARENDDSALSWAAYKARNSEVGYELVRRILHEAKSEAAVRNETHGFLPLHEAAWGNASRAVAVLLVAAFPSAVMRPNSSGQLPHQVGIYYHSHGFQWPSPDVLLAAAENFKNELSSDGQDWMDALSQRPNTMDLASRIFDRTNAGVQQPTELVNPSMGNLGLRNPDVEHSLPVRTVFPTLTSLRKANKPELGRDSSVEGDAAIILREPEAKASGRYAGMRRARNRRCNFVEKSKLFVNTEVESTSSWSDDFSDASSSSSTPTPPFGVSAITSTATVHYLRQHVVRAVYDSTLRPTPVPKWPAKAKWQRERTMDRIVKAAMSTVGIGA